MIIVVQAAGAVATVVPDADTATAIASGPRERGLADIAVRRNRHNTVCSR